MNDIKQYIDECQGIQPPHMAFYTSAIKFNLESAIVSINTLVSLMEERNLTKEPHALSSHILDSIQNALIHTACLSKYFWPINHGTHKLHKRRAQNLRKQFGVKDDSPIRNKELRNHLEHLDENLDTYLWKEPIVGNIYPEYVGTEMERNEVPYHFFRAFFIDSGTFESLGVRLDIQPIVDELFQLYRDTYSDENT